MNISAVLDDLALTTMCARCEARPGQNCTTITGKKAKTLHDARTKPIWNAYRVGRNLAYA